MNELELQEWSSQHNIKWKKIGCRKIHRGWHNVYGALNGYKTILFKHTHQSKSIFKNTPKNAKQSVLHDGHLWGGRKRGKEGRGCKLHRKVPPQGTPSLTPLILGGYWAFQREQACLDSSLWPQRPVWGMSMDTGQMMARGRLFVVFIKPRCWVGLVGEDRALIVL